MNEKKYKLIESRDDLLEYLTTGCKPAEQWKIGTEHEKFGFRLDDFSPLEYEGEQGIKAMLEGLHAGGWQAIIEKGNIIGLLADDGCSVTLEPGGQLELSGALLDNIHQTCSEVNRHLKLVKQVAERIGVGFIGLGFQPKWKRDEIPWMPKGRYSIMRDYMPKVGSMGLDMMLRTCTVQVNLDFSSEQDMVKKFRVSLALQPLATALFANSPFTEGKPNGFLSFRSEVWNHTDPDRCGMLPFVFDDSMGFERYLDYMLDVPMYFVYRDGVYHDVAGQSFRDFMKGNLPGLPGQLPNMKDWEDHLTTTFPEVRMKKYLEMRGADGGPWHRLCALPAFWTGILYDQASLDEAWEMVKDWSMEEREELRSQVPKYGLSSKVAGQSLQKIAMKVLALSEAGLKRRARMNKAGNDESVFLQTLWRVAESGKTPAERKLDLYYGDWQENIDKIFKDFAY